MTVKSDSNLILIVDDESRMRRFMKMNLDMEGCQVIEAENGLQAIDHVREYLPDLVIMDVMMPQLDGFETLEIIRKTSNVPVIMLTVRSDEDDIVRGLELGADDYITKPFSVRELVSRVKSVIRRSKTTSPIDKGLIIIDDYLQIDINKRQAIVGGKEIKLRPIEFKLLYHLATNAGWTIPHEDLLAKVWGHEYHDETNYVRLYITYVRQKIEPDLSNPKYIITERGVGYRFTEFEKKKS
ncbi:MAG: DNA-binding response regulator [Anaerolineaceae bacterium 4572_78]|nr:MAG: DNA-binding response regulator [Anaerolineaceae bacterium 4572_78]